MAASKTLKNDIAKLVESLQAHDFSMEYQAFLMAAFDELGGDIGQAVAAADAAFGADV